MLYAQYKLMALVAGDVEMTLLVGDYAHRVAPHIGHFSTRLKTRYKICNARLGPSGSLNNDTTLYPGAGASLAWPACRATKAALR